MSETTPEELRAEIEQTREELGDTVEELAAKTDVRARLADKRDELVDRAREAMPASAPEGVQQATAAVRRRPVPAAAIGAFAFGVLIGRMLARR
jgi:ElaB/YqjD/DUF883 family membrane-anchored ribosome-binding protein